MKKLYIFTLFLLSLPLVGMAQQKDELKGHPIVGIWDFDGFEVDVSSENKVFEQKMSQINKELEAMLMGKMDGAYMVFTEQGVHMSIEKNLNLTEFVVEKAFLSSYSILGSTIVMEEQKRKTKDFFRYEMSDDYLYLISERKELRGESKDSTGFNSDSVIYTLNTKARLKKPTRQLTSLNEHPITIGTWLCEEVIYDLDVDTDKEEEYDRVRVLFEESFQDKIAFWNNVFHFGSDGILYDLTKSENENLLDQIHYFIADDRTITAVLFNKNVYSADFQIQDNSLVLTISNLEGDFEVYASLQKEKLPPVKKAVVKMIYRSEK